MIFQNCDDLPAQSRQNHLNRRRRMDQLATLAHRCRGHLTEGERALLRLVLEHNSSFAAIAKVSRSNVSTVSRRYYRILRKLQQLSHRRTLDQQIRDAYRIGRRTQLQIASELNISRYRVRKALAAEARGQRQVNHGKGGSR